MAVPVTGTADLVVRENGIIEARDPGNDYYGKDDYNSKLVRALKVDVVLTRSNREGSRRQCV